MFPLNPNITWSTYALSPPMYLFCLLTLLLSLASHLTKFIFWQQMFPFFLCINFHSCDVYHTSFNSPTEMCWFQRKIQFDSFYLPPHLFWLNRVLATGAVFHFSWTNCKHGLQPRCKCRFTTRIKAQTNYCFDFLCLVATELVCWGPNCIIADTQVKSKHLRMCTPLVFAEENVPPVKMRRVRKLVAKNNVFLCWAAGSRCL